jgi:hypothetical protein
MAALAISSSPNATVAILSAAAGVNQLATSSAVTASAAIVIPARLLEIKERERAKLARFSRDRPIDLAQ